MGEDGTGANAGAGKIGIKYRGYKVFFPPFSAKRLPRLRRGLGREDEGAGANIFGKGRNRFVKQTKETPYRQSLYLC